jgi:hypothetical protein
MMAPGRCKTSGLCRSVAIGIFLGMMLEMRLIHASEEHRHTRLFPANDEYDSKVLDPFSVYGSPYGGFSRATRSRLAAMPLRLPDMATLDDAEDDSEGGFEEEALDTATYMETSDGLGRGYVCRVYHEDALEPTSLSDSMFDRPVLKDKTMMGAAMDGEETSKEKSLEDEMEGESEDEEEVAEAKDSDLVLMETQRRLKKLEGVCAQIHLGWWSYEWCYEQVSRMQFSRSLSVHLSMVKSSIFSLLIFLLAESKRL